MDDMTMKAVAAVELEIRELTDELRSFKREVGDDVDKIVKELSGRCDDLEGDVSDIEYDWGRWRDHIQYKLGPPK